MVLQEQKALSCLRQYLPNREEKQNERKKIKEVKTA